MRATPIAAIVLAMAISPVALAQTTNQTTTPPAATSPASPTSAQPGQSAQGVDGMSDDARTRARTRLGVGATATGDMPDRASAAMKQLTVNDIEDMDVYNTQGEKVGEVEEVVSSAGNQRYVVIAEGGFFGVGEDHASLPLDRFWVQGDDRLIVQGITDEDIDAMGNYRGNAKDYNEVDDDEKIDLATWPKS